ncbi:hypothetical protein L248_0465 [Schleiferilactobacillus shenzhenensis LY-73]|uniref:Thioredoxin domain-containing protein n=1 Tax=Schleiferilactobacillus shenzhenensis LY-73 TaxID=1231336 RepID=U4TJ83_9LACO|nr:hypothetical protein L248_0465 [Schleiferilactobacillus shenzhenensis LY-73]
MGEKIADKDSFSLFVYEPSCPPCQKEIKLLNTMRLGKQFYSLNLEKISAIENSRVKNLNIQYTPTLLKISHGTVIVRQEGFSDKAVLTRLQLNSPDTLISESFPVTKIFQPISVAQFEEMVKRGKSLIAYIGRPTCPDCASFEKSLANYDLSKYSGKVYYVNVELLHKDPAQWNFFKEQNSIQGTPAFVSYRAGKLISSSSWTVESGYSPKLALVWLTKEMK